jgi:L-alanine-DL-glutamate epimerase-like enolase superfamily enzyme
MKITQIEVYQVDLPLKEKAYNWSGGKSVQTFDSTVVLVHTDQGITGIGEVCPLGPVYLPSYAEGARTGIAVLAPALLGQDPTQIEKINRHRDSTLKGHPYAKSAIDIACWDILGQVAGLPLCTLLGGRYGDDFVLYRAISQQPPQDMANNVAAYREKGYRRFQLKVGSDVHTDIERIRAVAEKMERGDILIADANTGWIPPRSDAHHTRRTRHRCLHRVAVPHLRRMLCRPPRHRPPLHTRRMHRRHRHPNPRPLRKRHGRRQHKN